jgi:bacillithiol system protein YtxJ
MAFSFFKSKEDLNWTSIHSIDQLDAIQTASFTKPQVIFKHSTTCSISRMAKGRMEEGLEKLKSKADIYYLDLLAYRSISNEIAKRWNIQHESPQILVIIDGKSIYDASHNMIEVEEIEKYLV